MGKLSTLSRAVRTVEESASKGKAAERAWAAGEGRKGQLKGLSEYFERNDAVTAPAKPRAAAPLPADIKKTDRRAIERPGERRSESRQKIDLRRRADEAERLAGGYRRYADEMDANPRAKQYFVDANKLKALNDNFGFDVGDRMIELQNELLADELANLDPSVQPLIARGPGDEVFLAGNDDAIMREAIERANARLQSEGVHMDLPGGGRRTISGVSSLKYGAGDTLDDAEADLMARKRSGVDDRADASEAIDVIEEPRERSGTLGVIRSYINKRHGGLALASQYPDAVEGEYADGDEYLGEDDDYQYYAVGGPVQKGIGGFLKKAVKKVAKVGKVVAPILGKIPGIGTVAAGVIGGLSGLIADGNLKGALAGALNGVSGGLSGWTKLATSVGAQALDLSKPENRAKVAQMAHAQEQSQLTPLQNDLGQLRQQAMGTYSKAPTQLSMVQPQTPRVQPSAPAVGSQGLLQQIQQQRAASQQAA